MHVKSYIISGGIIFLCLLSCTQKPTEQVWSTSIFAMGSQSSPRAADLNGDGILDIVMGAGKEEITPTDQGIMALDGQTGDILWQVPANAHMVGSATFLDVTDDGTPDVFIGGRNSNLKAINGQTGVLLWEYQYQYADDPILQYARFNFYNATLVPDQDTDGYPDLLTVNGGNWEAAAGSETDRFPGVLLLLSTKTGQIIAADTMPDGKESYLSPTAFRDQASGDLKIVFGTGGETISGRLYLASLNDLLTRNLAQATVIAREEGHGFIAPPTLVDLNEDGQLDIVAISHAAKIFAIDGQTGREIWTKTFPGMETSNALAAGYFTNDRIPDLLAIVSKGVWPAYTTAHQILLDGSSGKVVWEDSIGCYTLSSPIVYDLNQDGFDEAIINTNQYDCQVSSTEQLDDRIVISNQLMALDFRSGRHQVIDQSPGFKNIYSTPLTLDLDQDGYLDLVYGQYIHTDNLQRFMGMRIKRVSTGVKMQEPPVWGVYLGSQRDVH